MEPVTKVETAIGERPGLAPPSPSPWRIRAGGRPSRIARVEARTVSRRSVSYPHQAVACPLVQRQLSLLGFSGMRRVVGQADNGRVRGGFLPRQAGRIGLLNFTYRGTATQQVDFVTASFRFLEVRSARGGLHSLPQSNDGVIHIGLTRGHGVRPLCANNGHSDVSGGAPKAGPALATSTENNAPQTESIIDRLNSTK